MTPSDWEAGCQHRRVTSTGKLWIAAAASSIASAVLCLLLAGPIL
ncbi:hypothetical protein [Kineococcus glutinatus]|uniref:Uncharacterized protein n=1 Tax=Kineococcus glutinatus TaxID=1070872 RepID=A0ABP9HPQ3_9ACTN